MRASRFLLTVLLLTLSACGRDGATEAVEIRAVAVFPTLDSLRWIPSSTHLSGAVLDAAGRPIDGAPAVAWRSLAPHIVAIDKFGLALALTNGTAQIEVSLGELKAYATIVVAQEAYFFWLSPSSVTLTSIGDSAQLSAAALDEVATPVTRSLEIAWASDHPAIATVNANGMVVARANGTTVIRAHSGNSEEGTATVIVALSR